MGLLLRFLTLNVQTVAGATTEAIGGPAVGDVLKSMTVTEIPVSWRRRFSSIDQLK